MPLEILPAIDISKGQAVRLRQGDFETVLKVAEDPVRVARKFQEAGATRLHIVDLDGAKMGSPQNLPVIREMIRKLSIPVQLGGGLRSAELIDRVFRAASGIDRVIVGTTAASADDALMLDILHRYGDKIVVGADTKAGYIATQGWTERTTETAAEFGGRLVAMGARRFLFTDIARDGMLEGVNLEATRAFALAVGVPVLASGGVGGIEDIQKLAAPDAQQSGIEGVIIGKALYAGRLTLEDALRIAAGG
ncbi:MAG: 1-(5-phosphoribosyl)-5-[(5-phosphoribosylamino)methylideneamino]imidazole-4-carboxamide isomerase [Cytophagales bacterium]|nr:1-(5-phosphoribosyl)-5-[(5-phosphoribosylamino)methylideneamino]imidazole-4-carboxamide isomerase [Armatimonadota bacterium]